MSEAAIAEKKEQEILARNGLLEVRLAKLEEVKPKEIEVQVS